MARISPSGGCAVRASEDRSQPTGWNRNCGRANRSARINRWRCTIHSAGFTLLRFRASPWRKLINTLFVRTASGVRNMAKLPCQGQSCECLVVIVEGRHDLSTPTSYFVAARSPTSCLGAHPPTGCPADAHAWTPTSLDARHSEHVVVGRSDPFAERFVRAWRKDSCRMS